MRARLFVPLLLLSGCGLAPDRFAKKVSFEWCDWRHRCDHIDAGQAEMCWETERGLWDEKLAVEDCDFARDRSRRLYGLYVDDLEATDCSLSDGYTLLAELERDVCQRAHSSWDTDVCCDETGETGE